MIDIVCPACQARYRLPDGAIGENGRKVSCSACGHGWVAHPEPEPEPEEEAPLTLGPEAIASAPKPAAPPPPPTPGAAGDSYADYDADAVRSGTSPYADEEDRGMAAYEAFAREQEEIDEAEGEGDDGGGTAPDRARDEPRDDPRDDPDEPPLTGPQRQEELGDDRASQMAQIRNMLNEIKQSPGASPAPEPDEPEEDYRPPERPTAAALAMREVEQEERDPLRAKLDQYARPGGSDPNTRYTRQKILKKHAKKVRRRKIEDKRGSGTFLTGFLLIVLVVSLMASIYLLHPLIIAKVPESEPAVRDYVATMDSFRAWAGEQIAALQTTVQDIISDE